MAGLRVDRKHILGTNLAVEASKGIEDILLERVVGVLAASSADSVLGALLPLGEAAASGIISVILGYPCGAVQVVYSSQEFINTVVSVVCSFEHLVNQARRVDQELCNGSTEG